MKNVKTALLTMSCTALLAFNITACDKDSSSASSGAAASAATTTATPMPTPVTIADSDLVTPADMEPQAETTITSANYKAQLASLETEMSKE